MVIRKDAANAQLDATSIVGRHHPNVCSWPTPISLGLSTKKFVKPRNDFGHKSWIFHHVNHGGDERMDVCMYVCMYVCTDTDKHASTGSVLTLASLYASIQDDKDDSKDGYSNHGNECSPSAVCMQDVSDVFAKASSVVVV
jgi:hypothetical protein